MDRYLQTVLAHDALDNVGPDLAPSERREQPQRAAQAGHREQQLSFRFAMPGFDPSFNRERAGA